MTSKYFLLLGLIFFMAGCGTPKTTTPAPTPEAIKIYYPISLQPWADQLSGCGTSFPQVALYFLQLANPITDFGPNDILLEFGQPRKVDNSLYLAQVGVERVVFIVNKANPVSQLTSTQVKQIFSGGLLKWEGETGLLIQVWVLPEDDSTRLIVDNALNVSLLAPNAKLAPDPQAMLKAISSDEASIGYLPQSYLWTDSFAGADQVKMIALDEYLKQELNQPVIASTRSEPSGYVRGLIACLQKFQSP